MQKVSAIISEEISTNQIPGTVSLQWQGKSYYFSVQRQGMAATMLAQQLLPPTRLYDKIEIPKPKPRVEIPLPDNSQDLDLAAGCLLMMAGGAVTALGFAAVTPIFALIGILLLFIGIAILAVKRHFNIKRETE